MHSGHDVRFFALRGAGEARGFAHLALPRYRHLLDFTDKWPEPVLVAARAGERPAGLAHALHVPGAATGEILSLRVAEELRRSGIGRQLLRQAQAALAARGAREAKFAFMTDDRDGMSALLAGEGWETPRITRLHFRFTAESVRAAPWLRRRAPGHRRRIAAWGEVPSEQRALLIHANPAKGWIPPDLEPAAMQSGFDASSVALLEDEDVVGWAVNHDRDGVLLVTSACVRPDLAGWGFFPLIAESMSRAIAAGRNSAEFEVPAWHPRMARFARRRMRAYATCYGETRETSRRLH